MSFPVPSSLSYPAPLVNSNKDSGNGLPFPINEVVFNLLTSTCALKQGWRNQIFRYYSLDKQRIKDSRLTYAAVHYLRIWKFRYPRQSPVRGLKKSMKIERKKKTWDERRQNSAQTYQYGFKKIISQDFLLRF